jgi:DNA primase
VVLTEGFFDPFKIWEMIEDYWRKKTRFVQCLCGNQISDAQMAELLGRVPETATIHIAFDNDKLSAAVKAYNLIRPYRNVHVAFPPETLGKDWDEAFKEDAAWSKKFWVLKLKGD